MSENFEYLEEFKTMLLSYNNRVSTEVFEAVFGIIDPKGYLSKEAELVFDVKHMKIPEPEKMKLYNDIQQIITLERHVNTIMRKSLKGKDFEKQVDFLIKKIKGLPERWQVGAKKQITDLLNSQVPKKAHDTPTLEALIETSKNITRCVDIQQKYNKAGVEPWQSKAQ